MASVILILGWRNSKSQQSVRFMFSFGKGFDLAPNRTRYEVRVDHRGLNPAVARRVFEFQQGEIPGLSPTGNGRVSRRVEPHTPFAVCDAIVEAKGVHGPLEDIVHCLESLTICLPEDQLFRPATVSGQDGQHLIVYEDGLPGSPLGRDEKRIRSRFHVPGPDTEDLSCPEPGPQCQKEHVVDHGRPLFEFVQQGGFLFLGKKSLSGVIDLGQLEIRLRPDGIGADPQLLFQAMVDDPAEQREDRASRTREQ